MAFPVIQYDKANGSNSAASGAGPATALTGSNAFSGDGAGGGTQTEIDLSTDSPDLSGVATDGSAAIYLATTSGERHLFQITAVDTGADIVTVHAAPDSAISSGSPVSWAIGGEREDCEGDTSNRDLQDLLAGWTAEFQAGTYPFTGTTTFAGEGGGDAPRMNVFSSDPGTVQPVFQHSGFAGSMFDSDLGADVYFDGMKFERASGSGSVYFLSGSSWGGGILRRIEMDCTGMRGGANAGGTSYAVWSLIDVKIYGADATAGSSFGLSGLSGSFGGLALIDVSIHDVDGDAIVVQPSSGRKLLIRNVRLYDVTQSGLNVGNFSSSGFSIDIDGLTVYAADGDGIEFTDTTPNGEGAISIQNSTISGCGGYALNGAAAVDNLISISRNNHYYDNTSGNSAGMTTGEDSASGDPQFTSVTDGSEDFSFGSGSPLEDAGYAVGTD